MDMVLSILEALKEEDPQLMQKCLMELEEACLKYGHTDAAMIVYRKMHVLSFTDDGSACMDVQGVERLLVALKRECRIEDMKFVLTTSPLVNDDIIVLVAEPLIMAGQLNWFTNKIFKKFVRCIPESNSVSRVIRALMRGRARRHMSFTRPLPDEKVGLKTFFLLLEAYHQEITRRGNACEVAMELVMDSIDRQDTASAGATVAEIAATSDAAAAALSKSSPRQQSFMNSLSYLPSSFAARQLYEMEKYVMSLEMDRLDVSPEEAFFLRLTPKFEDLDFPFLTEDKHVAIDGLHINDMTAQLEVKYPTELLLMSGSLFHIAYDFERKQFHQRHSAEHLLRGLLGIIENARGELELAHDQYDSDDSLYAAALDDHDEENDDVESFYEDFDEELALSPDLLDDENSELGMSDFVELEIYSQDGENAGDTLTISYSHVEDEADESCAVSTLEIAMGSQQQIDDHDHLGRSADYIALFSHEMRHLGYNPPKEINGSAASFPGLIGASQDSIPMHPVANDTLDRLSNDIDLEGIVDENFHTLSYDINLEEIIDENVHHDASHYCGTNVHHHEFIFSEDLFMAGLPHSRRLAPLFPSNEIINQDMEAHHITWTAGVDESLDEDDE